MDNIILITIDSLRKDHFNSEYLGESWDTIRSEFTRFENCYSNGISTPLAFPSILTGYPVVGDGTLRSDAQTLAESYSGYSWASTNNPHLREDRGYARGFSHFESTWRGRDDREKGSSEKFIAKLKRLFARSDLVRTVYHRFKDRGMFSNLKRAMGSQSGFYWHHVMRPHSPFTTQKVTDRDLDVEHSETTIEAMNERFLDRHPTKEDLEVLRYLYGEIVRYTDRQLASFFDHLKSEGRWEDSMIVLMSDHGESFGEGGVVGHRWSADPIDVLVQVPLSIKYPAGRHQGETYDHLVQNGDLLATLADHFDWAVGPPHGTFPFTDSTERRIVSKSNAAVRLTTDDGYGIRRRDGTEDIEGLDESATELLYETEFPAVEHMSGDVAGLTDEEEEEVEQRLHDLGYR